MALPRTRSNAPTRGRTTFVQPGPDDLPTRPKTRRTLSRHTELVALSVVLAALSLLAGLVWVGLSIVRAAAAGSGPGWW